MTGKLISVLLSAVFVLSCFSTAFVAFAENETLTDPSAALLENTVTAAESEKRLKQKTQNLKTRLTTRKTRYWRITTRCQKNKAA